MLSLRQTEALLHAIAVAALPGQALLFAWHFHLVARSCFREIMYVVSVLVPVIDSLHLARP